MAEPGDRPTPKAFLAVVWVMAGAVFLIVIAGAVVGLIKQRPGIYIPSILVAAFMVWLVRTRGHTKGTVSQDEISFEGEQIGMAGVGGPTPGQASEDAELDPSRSRWSRAVGRCSQLVQKVRR